MSKFLFVDVVSYEFATDQLKITVPVIEVGEPEHTESCVNDMLDADDFDIDAGVFAHLVGVFDEPEYFVGRRFKLPSALNTGLNSPPSDNDE